MTTLDAAGEWEQASAISAVPNLSPLPADTKAKADEYARKIGELQRTIAPHLFEIGEVLRKTKRLLGHGHFGIWLKENNWSARTAQNYMSVAEHFALNFATVSHLPPTTLYRLAATTADVREEICERIDQGEELSPKAIVEIIGETVPKRKAAKRPTKADDGGHVAKAKPDRVGAGSRMVEPRRFEAVAALGDWLTSNLPHDIECLLDLLDDIRDHAVSVLVEELRRQLAESSTGMSRAGEVVEAVRVTAL